MIQQLLQGLFAGPNLFPPIAGQGHSGPGPSEPPVYNAGPTTPDAATTPYNPLAAAEQDALAKRDQTRAALLGSYDQPLPAAPRAVNPAFLTEDLVKGLLPAVLISLFDKSGKAGGEYAQRFLKGKELKAAQDTQAKQQDYQNTLAGQERGQQKLALANQFAEGDARAAQANTAADRQQKLQIQREREVQGKTLRAQYFAANTPAEKMMAARLLQENYPEYAPINQEVQRDIESLSQPEAKQFNDDMRRFKDAAYFESDKELGAALGQYSTRRSQLIAAGIPERMLDPVIDVKSVKQYRAEAAAEAKKKALDLARDRFNFDKEFKDRNLKQRLELGWANYELARDNFGLAIQRNQMAAASLQARLMQNGASQAATVIKARIQEATRQISARVTTLRKQKLTADQIDNDPQIKALRAKIEGDPGTDTMVAGVHIQKEPVVGYIQQLEELDSGLSDAGVGGVMDQSLYGAVDRAMAGRGKEIKATAGPSPYRNAIITAAGTQGLPASFLDAIIHAESNYNPKSTSKAGAQGIAQFMPETAKQYGIDPFNPDEAIPAAAKHLAALLKKYGGNFDLAAAAYNAGEGAVAKYGGVPPYKETQNYVRRVAMLMGRKPGEMPKIKPTGGPKDNNKPGATPPKKPAGGGGSVLDKAAAKGWDFGGG